MAYLDYSGLEYYNNKINPKINASSIINTASGALASFSDGAKAPVKSLLADINPIQSGSGDPSPTNIRPISGLDTVNLKRTGKNFATLNNPELKPSTAQTICFLSSLKGTYDFILTFDLVNATSQLKASALFDLFADNGHNYRVQGQIRRLSDGAYLNSLTQPITGRFYALFANITNPQYLVTYWESNNYDKWSGEMQNVQFELGSTASSYEPYNGESHSISLGQTVYGGKLNVTSGVLTVDKAIVDLGDLTWERYSTAGAYKFQASLAGAKIVTNQQTTTAICTNYKAVSFGSLANTDMGFSIGVNGAAGVAVHDSTYYDSDATAFKAAMSGVKVVYPLATPQTITLTPTEVQTILGYNNIFADSGEVEVAYVADSKLYIDNAIAAALATI